MYQSEINKLKALLSENVYNLLKDNKAIIAGGTITSLFTNNEVNDIDVYLPSQRAVVNILASTFGKTEYTESEVEYFSMIFINMSDKSMLFSDKGTQTPVQLTTFQYFDKPEDIFKTFDYTCCMGAFVLETEEFVFHEEFLKHNSQRYLKFNPGTAFPIMSALRVQKYLERGYKISKSEFLRVVLTCLDLDINSWEVFKSHIGGMYGYNMDKLFNETIEFSIVEAVEQLGSLIEGVKHEYEENAPMEFEAILERFDPAEEMPEEGPPSPYKEGFFYKHVKKDSLSSLFTCYKTIHYNIGEIVNGGDNGIYVHKDPLYPHYNNGYNVCVELEPMGDVRVIGGYHEKRVIGDLKVTRIVPDYTPGLSKTQRKYRVEG